MSNCPVCGDVFDKALTEDGLTTYDHHEDDTIRTCEVLVGEVNGTVPKEDLRELVEEWRGDIEMTGFDKEIAAKNQTLSDCAEQLEEVLEE